MRIAQRCRWRFNPFSSLCNSDDLVVWPTRLFDLPTSPRTRARVCPQPQPRRLSAASEQKLHPAGPTTRLTVQLLLGSGVRRDGTSVLGSPIGRCTRTSVCQIRKSPLDHLLLVHLHISQHGILKDPCQARTSKYPLQVFSSSALVDVRAAPRKAKNGGIGKMDRRCGGDEWAWNLWSLEVWDVIWDWWPCDKRTQESAQADVLAQSVFDKRNCTLGEVSESALRWSILRNVAFSVEMQGRHRRFSDSSWKNLWDSIRMRGLGQHNPSSSHHNISLTISHCPPYSPPGHQSSWPNRLPWWCYPGPSGDDGSGGQQPIDHPKRQGPSQGGRHLGSA